MSVKSNPSNVRNGYSFEISSSYDKEEILAKVLDDKVKSYICELYALNQYNKELIRNLCKEKKKAVADKNKYEKENDELQNKQTSNSSTIAVLTSERDRLRQDVRILEAVKKETEEKNEELTKENVKLREEKSLVSGTNNTLRCELKAFYQLAVTASICFAGADILSDWALEGTIWSWVFWTILVIVSITRLVGIVIISCEAHIAKSTSNRELIDANSRQNSTKPTAEVVS